MTHESQSRRARRRRRETLRGQSHQMQDPGQLATHRAHERWRAAQEAKERLQRKLDALARLAAIRGGRL